ncbi:MAG: hypothetical protein IPM48_07860 [Saprospiraceae bacterium]|nr:hypothetical protein [Saprospiraceae bacterium]
MPILLVFRIDYLYQYNKDYFNLKLDFRIWYSYFLCIIRESTQRKLAAWALRYTINN